MVVDGSPQDEVWSDLIVAILAVNNYSLDRAFALVPALRSAGFCSPENLAKWDDPDAIAIRLKDAGLQRSGFMGTVYARRLASLGSAIKTVGVSEFTSVLSSKLRADIIALLSPIDGIGPTVLSNFFVLRGIEKP